MTVKNKVNVSIDGRNFTVVGEGSKEYMQELAFYVDKNIKEMTNKNNRLSSSMAAILAAFNISDELYKVKGQLKIFKGGPKGFKDKYQEVLRQLEESREKNQALSINCQELGDELADRKREEDQLNKKIKNLQEAIELKEAKMREKKDLIEKLQGKIYDNQIQIIESKKELEEALKVYDKEKNIFHKEDI